MHHRAIQEDGDHPVIELFFKNASDTKVTKYLASYHAKIFENTVAMQRELMTELMTRIKAKLSGAVLAPRTGKLKESVQLEDVVTTGEKVIGRVVVGEGLGLYPLVQEYGGRKHYEITPRTKQALAFFPTSALGARSAKGKAAKLKHLGESQYFRRSLHKRGRLKPTKFTAFSKAGGIVVKRVEREPLPVRSYVRSSLAEMRDRMVEQIRVTISRSLN